MTDADYTGGNDTGGQSLWIFSKNLSDSNEIIGGGGGGGVKF